MTTANLNVPLLQGGIQNTNFFNGRVLAAEDLTALQLANAQQHRQLGGALGDGVAWGLNATLSGNSNPKQPILHVTKGLAFNRKGDTVALAADVDLALIAASEVQNSSAGLFAACQPPVATIPTNLDCYILTASAASGLQGSAPMVNVTSAGFASSCASAYAVEGIQFNLLPLGVSDTGDPTTLRGQATQLYATLQPLFVQLAGLTGAKAGLLEAQIAPQLSMFRSVVAHLCFGTDQLAGFAAGPLAAASGVSPFTSYGALDNLRAQGYLTDCAVPLALVYWTAAGVQFVDMWSVRRPLTPVSASLAWPLFSGRRRIGEGLAMFLQFQDHIATLQSTLGLAPLASVSAAGYFRYLPPAGLIPVNHGKIFSGFDYLQFFLNRTYRSPVYVEGEKLYSLVMQAMGFPPIDLNNREMLWLYSVRDNQESIDNTSTNPPQLYFAFTNGQMPFQGAAKYDLNYWNYANLV
jgi:hypothetical protein